MSEQPFRRDTFVLYEETGPDLHLRVLECERTPDGLWIVTAQHDACKARVKAPSHVFEQWVPLRAPHERKDYKARIPS